MEQSEEIRCAFFLEKKKRYCRFKPAGNTKYCPEHAGILGVNQRERIACPLNSKHYCYKDSLEKHLKKCRKQQKDLPPYYSQGINTDNESANTRQEMKIPLKEFSTSELQDLIKKVNDLYDEHVKHIDEDILHHPCLDEELNNESFGIPAIRHRKQQASLVGQLQTLDLLREGLCYVELGAGKGNLSHWIQQALPDKTDLGFVLVDYGHVRYKADNRHKWPDTGPKFERLRIDIANLNLGKVESISSNQRPVVAVGKHLCGAATDLALRCVTKTLRVGHSEESVEQPEHKKLKTEDNASQSASLAGVTIALCCHHRCTWDAYVGKEFLQGCGLTPRDFVLLCKLSGWTAATWTGWKTKEEMKRESKEQMNHNIEKEMNHETKEEMNHESKEQMNHETKEETNCETKEEMIRETKEFFNSSENQGDPSTAAGKVTEKSSSVSQLEDEKTDVQQSTDSNGPQEHADTGPLFSRSDLQLSPSQREEIGRKCKRLIDIGRVHYLRNRGLQSQLKTYIEEKLTPENVIIVANTAS